VLGINVASTYLGLSVGPFVGGFMTYQFGWRSIVLSVLVPGIPVILFVLRKVKGEWFGTRGETFDWRGALIYGCALVAVMYGFSILPGAAAIFCVGIGVMSFALFVRLENRVTFPLLDLHLFRENIVYAFSNLAALINYSATFAVTFLLSLYLQYIKGLDPQHAGTIIIAQPVMMTVLSPLAGRLSDVIEPRIVSSVGMALTAIGLGLLSLLTATTSVWYIVAVLVVLGCGFAFFSSPNTNAVMSSVEKRWLGVASATLGTMRLTGQMMSMGIAMLVFAVHMGRVQVTPGVYPEFLQSSSSAFLIFTVLCTLGVFASLARGKVRS
jgi:MFS family permease